MTGKRAILCAILTSMLFVIGCSSDDPDVYGAWTAPSMTLNAGSNIVTNVVITLNNNGTYSLTFTGGGGPNTESGTFTPVKVDENTDVTFTVTAKSGAWASALGSNWYAKYTGLKSSTMNFYMNRGFGFGYEGPYVMTK